MSKFRIYSGKPQLASPKVLRATVLLLVVLIFLVLAGTVSAQAGSGQLTVNACIDQNADGICGADDDALEGVQVCLNDEATCQAAPAVFTNLEAGEYTPFLRFGGTTLGYYPTTPRTAVNLDDGESDEVTLGAVYPVHPKGVAVHSAMNKVYVVFQGPAVGDVKPYPFVAVIDGNTDEVLRTIPGGENGSAPGAPNGMGIGREPWGVAVSANGEFVYVGSFGDGIVTAIDPDTDRVVANVSPGGTFQPTAPAVNPITGRVSFPDHTGGRVIVLNDNPNSFSTSPILSIVRVDNFPSTFAPFELAAAKNLQGHNFVSMRSAADDEPFKFVGYNTATLSKISYDILFDTSSGEASGIPHAAAVWQDEGIDEARLFMTYADDSRPLKNIFPNPNKVLLYDFSALKPDEVSLYRADVEVGDYAEVGLVYNPAANHLLGTYAGFAYIGDEGDEAACNNSKRGGTYALDFEGNIITGDSADVWRFPERAVGNPVYTTSGMQWRNPFEIAVNPNNNKVYITDRCWNDYPTGGQASGGAVLVFEDTSTEPRPTPTPTATVTGTPPTATPTVTGTPPTSTPTVTGTPPTATPGTGTPGTPGPTGTPSVTTTPGVESLTLAFDGPATVTSGDTFTVAVRALDVGGLGLYGAQLQVNYDPALISADNLQINPDLVFVVLDHIDNTTGQITFLASRQGQVSGLTGDVTLFTFAADAVGSSGETTFTFENERVGDPIARPFEIIKQAYTVAIQPLPTVTGTPGTGTPSVTGTPGTGTPSVTGTPGTSTPSVTGTPGTETPSITGTPGTGTPSVTGTPGTGTPSVTGTPGTDTPTPNLTQTPGTGTPSVTGTPGTGTPTPNLTQTPGTGTPSVTGTPGTGTPSVTGTPGTGTPSVTGTPGTGTPSVTGTPGTGTPSVTGTPGTGTPSVTGTPGTGTPSVTGTPGTGTPSVTGTPTTPTPGVTVVITITGTPGASTPTVTGTPPTATPTVTGTPPTVTPGVTVVITVTGTPGTPVATATPSGPRVIIIIGQVSLPGREDDDWSGTTVVVEVEKEPVAPMQATTNSVGQFSLAAEIPPGETTLKADAPGYLPAVCKTSLQESETSLTNTALLSGDINDDDQVDITDAVAIGLGFGTAGNVPADINLSGNVDVLDVILVGVNFGEGKQEWQCLPE